MFLNYPKWKTWLWRLIRGAVHTAIAETIVSACGVSSFDLLQCFTHVYQNWTNPKAFILMITVAFISGFLQALGLAIRDNWSNQNPSHFANKLPI